MSMTRDPKLVEAVARAIAELNRARGDNWREWENDARAAIAAIDASGTHWVAPWEANETMAAAYGGYYADNWRKGHALEDTSARDAWNDMRAAYLEDGGTADAG
jgi:hypothetical protein